jgi:hypothetical protein
MGSDAKRIGLAERPLLSALVALADWLLWQPGWGDETFWPGRSFGPELSAFAGFRVLPEVILFAVRCYLRYGLTYRDLEGLLAERGVEVHHVTLYRWVLRFTPLLVDAARPCRSRYWLR